MAFIKKYWFTLVMVLAVGGFVAFNGVGFFGKTASESKYVYDGRPEIYAVTFSSAWCSTCKILEPKLAEVAPDFANKPVKFVKLDFSLGQGGAPEKTARDLNFMPVYEKYKGGTGFTLLLNADTGEIVDRLTVKLSSDEMKQALDMAIKQVI
ncbi:TlpA family protein disulfide reductase [Hirschia litorea]|uniref:TlpA family protein disulfide reductase n=1 Tax=Hirschia litorea TaxID=1199156 RepID=A0ABW2IM49_9PROT